MHESDKNGKYPLYVFLLILQCAIFGFSFVIVKMLLDYGNSPFLLMGIRFFIGAISLVFAGLVLNAKTSQKRTVFAYNKKELLYGAISGIALFAAFGFQTFGANFTTPAKNSLLTGVFVVFVPLVSMFLKKKFSAKPIVIALICFVGAGTVSGISASDLNINLGDILTIICGIAFAIHFLLLERYAPDSDIDTIKFTEVQLFVVAITSVLSSILLESHSYVNVDWQNSLLWFVFIGVISTAVTYLIQTIVQAKLTANTVSVISCTDSVFAITTSLILGYEILSGRLLIGGVIIIVSMIMASVQKQDSKV